MRNLLPRLLNNRLILTLGWVRIPENNVIFLYNRTVSIPPYREDQKNKTVKTYQSQRNMNRRRERRERLLRLLPLNHRLDILRHGRGLGTAGSCGLAQASISDIAQRKEVRVLRVLELHGGTDTNEAVVRVDERIGRRSGESLDQVVVGFLASGKDDELGCEFGAIVQLDGEGRAVVREAGFGDDDAGAGDQAEVD